MLFYIYIYIYIERERERESVCDYHFFISSVPPQRMLVGMHVTPQTTFTRTSSVFGIDINPHILSYVLTALPQTHTLSHRIDINYLQVTAEGLEYNQPGTVNCHVILYDLQVRLVQTDTTADVRNMFRLKSVWDQV